MTIRLNFVASVAAIALGWGSVVIRADAQGSSAPSPSGTLVSVAPGVDSSSDLAVKRRVEAALQAAKYSLETHVEVSVEKGTVVLSGFVLSEWDRRHAIAIARKEGGDRKVIDEIHLKELQEH
jgi:osmotically-inducible protein OsmY